MSEPTPKGSLVAFPPADAERFYSAGRAARAGMVRQTTLLEPRRRSACEMMISALSKVAPERRGLGEALRSARALMICEQAGHGAYARFALAIADLLQAEATAAGRPLTPAVVDRLAPHLDGLIRLVRSDRPPPETFAAQLALTQLRTRLFSARALADRDARFRVRRALSAAGEAAHG